MHKADALFSKR